MSQSVGFYVKKIQCEIGAHNSWQATLRFCHYSSNRVLRSFSLLQPESVKKEEKQFVRKYWSNGKYD